MRTPPTTRRFTVRLPAELVEWLDQHLDEDYPSRTALITQALWNAKRRMESDDLRAFLAGLGRRRLPVPARRTGPHRRSRGRLRCGPVATAPVGFAVQNARQGLLVQNARHLSTPVGNRPAALFA